MIAGLVWKILVGTAELDQGHAATIEKKSRLEKMLKRNRKETKKNASRSCLHVVRDDHDGYSRAFC